MSNREIINTFWGSWNKKSIVSSLLYFGSASLLFLFLYSIQSYNYLLFHSMAELISASSSFIIFVIVFSVWRHLESDNYLCFLGIAFFFTGLIDVVHLLAFKGMSIFNEFDGDLPVQLWILARYIEAFSLLIATMLIRKSFAINKYLLFFTYTLIVGFGFATIFHWKTFPVCFAEETGLTGFTISSEYMICVIFTMSMLMMIKSQKYFNKKILRLLILSTFFRIITELAFTTYLSPYAFANFIGHYFKIISVMLFCQAIVMTAIGSPIKLLFAKLEKRQYQLKKAQRIGNMGSWELNLITSDFTWSNQTLLILEVDKSVMNFSYPVFLKMIHPDDCEERKKKFIAAINNQSVYNSIHRLVLINGTIKFVHERGELSYDEENNPERMNCIIKDITDQKKNEEEILRLNINLEKIVMERTIQLEEMNCELEATNAMLEEEICERQKVEEKIHKLNDELEDKVKERTSQLDASNALLSAILDSSPEIIVFSLDVNYCYLTFNTRHQENMRVMWGKNIKIGMNFLDVIGSDEAVVRNVKGNFQRVLTGESFITVEEYGDKQDMRLFYQNYWSPIFAIEGKVIGITCFVMDITQSKLLHERLEKYQVLAENANDAMMFIDDEGNILEVNDAAIRMYGYTFEEFLHMTIYDLRKIKKTPEITEQLRRAHQEGIIFETCHYRKDGTSIQVEVSSQNNLLGKTKGLLSIVRDVTERKKAQEEILIALKKAEDANVAKSQFLANMSHEIRTPMNGIIGMTELTLMTNLEEEQREYLNIVKSSTKSLLRVVNDILDYSKIEAGKIDLEKTPFELRKTINEVMELFDIGARQKGLSIRDEVDEEVPEKIIGDAVRLRQILSNLVGNAIKFTEQGEVNICVHVVEQYRNKITLRFEISDTGMGIPEEQIGKLFKRFSQVDESNTRRFGGTGLGLAISKKLIEIMDGEIGVESKENVGSNFFFTAIFDSADNKQSLSKDTSDIQLNKGVQQGARKILLAEDDLVSRNMLTIVLEREGYIVVGVENGIEAVSAFEKEKFDVVLMDVNMPYLDGYSATMTIRLKEKEFNSRTPIIAITAYALKGDREKCLKADMDDYISKPVNFGEVLELIRKYLQVDNNKKSVKISNNGFVKNVDELMEASGFDRQTSISILNDFCGQAVWILQGIKTSIAENKLAEVKILVHQLKGSAGNVRAKEIAKTALAAEEAIRQLDNKLLGNLLEDIEAKVEDLMRNSKEG